MTRDETKQLLMAISSVYNSFKVPTEQMPFTVDMWNKLLEDLDYALVQQAFMSFGTSDTSGFAPTPSQIREKVVLLSAEPMMNESEAWGLVIKALRNSNYHAKEEFEKLPPLVQKAVGSPEVLQEWGRTETKVVGSVIQSNFEKTYRCVADVEQTKAKMPETIQNLIQSRDKIKSAQIGAKISETKSSPLREEKLNLGGNLKPTEVSDEFDPSSKVQELENLIKRGNI